MHIHLKCKGWLAFQVTKQAQSTGCEILQASAKKGMQNHYSRGKDSLVGTRFQTPETAQIPAQTQKNSLMQCTFSSLKSSHQALMLFIQTKGVFQNNQLPGNSWHALSPKNKTDRLPEVEGIAFRKLFALAGSHIEDNSLFPIALNVTGSLEFG